MILYVDYISFSYALCLLDVSVTKTFFFLQDGAALFRCRPGHSAKIVLLFTFYLLLISIFTHSHFTAGYILSV